MNRGEPHLFDRLRDLQATLGEDVDWLEAHTVNGAVRPDGLRDLGERLTEVGAALVNRADELDARTLALLPPDGWIPDARSSDYWIGQAHNVGDRPLRLGTVYMALCGEDCFPLYGRDTTRRIARHVRCQSCLRWSQGYRCPGS